MSICTNCALLAWLFDEEGKWKIEPGLVVILIMEHALLLIKFGFSRLVPSEPAWVRAACAKNSSQARDMYTKRLLRTISGGEKTRELKKIECGLQRQNMMNQHGQGDRREKKKEETITHNAQLHATISVAAVAFAVAAITAAMAASSAPSKDERMAKIDMAMASAATLVATQSVEAAEATRA
ncbi:hypothetical protein HN51_012444 [Arachis hypogaea]